MWWKVRYLVVKLLLLIIVSVLCACAPSIEEEYPPKWVIASYYLPKEKLQGLRNAGFFEIQNTIYSHHCDSHGNMIRMKYNEDGHTWKQIKYETHGCIENTL